MSIFLYSEINVFCIIIMGILLIKIQRGINRQKEQQLFHAVLLNGIAFMMADLCWGLASVDFFPPLVLTNYLINVLYYILSGTLSCSWFFYAENVMQSPFLKSKKKTFLAYVPMLLLTFLSATDYLTHWIFYIDANGDYHQGIFYGLQFVLGYGYIVLTTIKAFVRAMKKGNYAVRSRYMTLVSFAIPPLIFGIIQVFLPNVPMLCMGITLGGLLVYINSTEQQISIDPLTQLNNRGEMIRYLSGKMKSGRRSDKKLFLLMMDANGFKKINDHFGHVEGDVALMRISATLKYVCAKWDCFAARYGGDEFIAIIESESSEDIAVFCSELHVRLMMANVQAKASYALTLSVGYAEYTDDTMGIPEFIAAADKKLYEAKRARKEQIQEKSVEVR